MVRLFSSTTAYALATAYIVNAQTFTDCNPLQRTDCPIRPGFTEDYSVDFRNGPDGTWKNTAYPVVFGSQGAEFNIKNAGESVTYASDKHLLFGRVEVKMKVAPGQGIVSSFVLQSDDLDEIDWEMIGSETTRAQSNYFGKGDTSSYDRGGYHNVQTPAQTYHTYAIDWTKDQLQWIIDGVTVRTLKYNDASRGTRYPQTPMQIRLGNWIGGSPNNTAGTIGWAGGLADLSKGPFSMYVESVKVKNYSPAAAYQYGDKSGSWQSIKLLSTYNTPTSSSSASLSAASASKAQSSAVVKPSSAASQPSSAASQPSSAAVPKPSLALSTSQDGSCGAAAGFSCLGATDGDCCSEYNYCGSTAAYCGTGCQAGFGKCDSGASTPVPGKDGEAGGDKESVPVPAPVPAPAPAPVPAQPKPVYSGSFPFDNQQKKVLEGFMQKLCVSSLAKWLPSCK